MMRSKMCWISLVGQWALVDAADVLEDGLFALGFVDGQIALALESADGDGGLGALVDELHDLFVEGVDLLTPAGNPWSVASISLLTRMPHWSTRCAPAPPGEGGRRG